MRWHFVIAIFWSGVTIWAEAPAGEKAEKKILVRQAEQNGVLISASIPTESVAGLALNVKIGVQNKGKEVVGYSSSGDYGDYYLQLFDLKGRTVRHTQEFQGVSPGGRGGFEGGLAFGEKMEATINLGRIFDLSQPGEYRLSISTCCCMSRGGKSADVKIENIPVKITEEGRSADLKPKADKTNEKKVVEKDIVMMASISEKANLGSAANLTVRVENQGKTDVRFNSRSRYGDYDLQLFDSDGKAVPLTQFGKHAYGKGRKEVPAKSLTLATGKDMQATLNVARLFDLSKYPGGEYKVTLSCELWGAQPGQTIRLKIEDLKFRVVP